MEYFYYKDLNNNYYAFYEKQESEEFIEITKEEFDNRPQDIVEYSEEEIAKYNRINELKSLLAMSDYKAIKYAEGQISESDYAPIKAERQGWRDEINELEGDN